MADIPLMQFPPSQAPAIAAAVTGLLCAVLGAVQVIDGVITAAADEGTVLARLAAATDAVQTAAGVGFEQARWAAAGGVKAAASA